MILGVLLGVFGHIAYSSMCKIKKPKKPLAFKSHHSAEADEPEVNEEDEWEDESSEDESGFRRNTPPNKVDEKELFE